MLKGLRDEYKRFKSVWFKNESPISTIEKRLYAIEKTMAIFGWDTQRESWRPSILTILTPTIVFTSLILDVDHSINMFDNREDNDIQDIVETLVFIVTQSICSYRIFITIRYRMKNRYANYL